MKTSREHLQALRQRFARATLRCAMNAPEAAPQRTELLTAALPLLLGPSREWNAGRARALEEAIAWSLTPDARRAASAAIGRAHAHTNTYGSAASGPALLAHLPDGGTLRGRFVARHFQPEPPR